MLLTADKNQNEAPVHGGTFPRLAPSNGIPCFELIVMTNTVEARYDAETDVGVMHDEARGTQIASLETAVFCSSSSRCREVDPGVTIEPAEWPWVEGQCAAPSS